jgi:hypothetical protein
MKKEIYVLCRKGSFYLKIVKFLKKILFKNIEIIEHSGETVRGNIGKIFDYYDSDSNRWVTIDGNKK